ncbi:hypothetical protein PAXRUDRAFT_830623 [Paxillus rubicundulus Ve08.2h10]|uniref:Unplaced genomic scaffold scaffold_539, whole genome shotgun sequence n=1 Tax=Paxillus rubicundulus Ve08.2h10 TaxID=930991 RepID=A0A0D0DT71_9AGAM|nr:hypothetical protein PAXRUDRAFT_830623 [Paxillus rubicundulus Ve08.2h10]
MAWGWFDLRGQPTQKWIGTQKGGHLQYLTIQGLSGAWLCMVFSAFCDLFPSVALVRRFKRALLMIALPLAFVISTIYWFLFLFFPALILRPEPYNDSEPTSSSAAPPLMLVPLKTDLALHATPFITLLFDFFVFECKFTKEQINKGAPAVVLVYGIWYASLVEYCATFNGSFPYPFLTYSPFEIRAVIYTTVAGLALGCLRVLNALHS